MMRTLLIVWHSRTGAARQMAHAAALGARHVADTLAEHPDSLDQATTSTLRVHLRHALRTSTQDVLHADGFIFCAPENLGALSGEMKTFFDRRYYDALDQIAGRPYGLIVTAGSDGTGAVRQATRICTGWRLRSLAEPIIVCFEAQTAAAILAPKDVDEQMRSRAFELGGLAAGTLLLGC